MIAALVRMNTFYYDARLVPGWRVLIDVAVQSLLLKEERRERGKYQKEKTYGFQESQLRLSVARSQAPTVPGI